MFNYFLDCDDKDCIGDCCITKNNKEDDENFSICENLKIKIIIGGN